LPVNAAFTVENIRTSLLSKAFRTRAAGVIEVAQRAVWTCATTSNGDACRLHRGYEPGSVHSASTIELAYETVRRRAKRF